MEQLFSARNLKELERIPETFCKHSLYGYYIRKVSAYKKLEY